MILRVHNDWNDCTRDEYTKHNTNQKHSLGPGRLTINYQNIGPSEWTRLHILYLEPSEMVTSNYIRGSMYRFSLSWRANFEPTIDPKDPPRGGSYTDDDTNCCCVASQVSRKGFLS